MRHVQRSIGLPAHGLSKCTLDRLAWAYASEDMEVLGKPHWLFARKGSLVLSMQACWKVYMQPFAQFCYINGAVRRCLAKLLQVVLDVAASAACMLWGILCEKIYVPCCR